MPLKWPTKPATVRVISHRSGETEDVTIADLAVATNAGQIKNRIYVAHRPHRQIQSMIRIEEQLGEQAIFLGEDAL